MPPANRDRDESGRARNARPRDGLGRPLEYGSEGIPTMPDDLQVTAERGLVLAQELLDAGRPFHAHEVLEALWKAAESQTERELWHGLAQLAVGLTHEARGNAVGAQALISRGRGGLLALPMTSHGVDVEAVLRWAEDWLAGERGRPLRLIGGVGGGT